MTFLEQARKLALEGFYVFPLNPGRKTPAIPDFAELATRDLEKIDPFWIDPVMELIQPMNIGISTSNFGDGEALLVIDIDDKDGRCGSDTLFNLEAAGFFFPPTRTQKTPSGGTHLIYRVKEALKQGADVLGSGLDIRSRGGYIVAANSVTEAGHYEMDARPIAPAPEWLVTRLRTFEPRGEGPSPKEAASLPKKEINQDMANERARAYLEGEAPHAVQGAAGDETTFKVACRLRDLGCSRTHAVTLLLDHWNEKCSPPWHPSDLEAKVQNAYDYGTRPFGNAAPETQFSPVEKAPDDEGESPLQTLNREYAFVIAGGGAHILWETYGPKGEDRLEHLSIPAFHQKHASQFIYTGGKARPLTEVWMKSSERRSYDGICFIPGKETPPAFYNLWRGFSIEPLSVREKPTLAMERALAQFIEHARANVCGGDESLFKWLMGYFAHMVQKPWEKPLTALVFRGKKGVGKNALIDRVGNLVGTHYLLTSNRRYLTGNFNGHLENLLLFVLDEAFWSGDKQAEGTLKDLITGKTHLIEHKGKESYSVDNCTRIAIIGNEEWLVPASHDERRFAVFDVGSGKQQDTKYFHDLRVGIDEEGGARLLLRYLLDYDLSSINVNVAPATGALLDQKLETLHPVHQWLYSSLVEGEILGSDFINGWPDAIDKDTLIHAIRRYLRDRNIKGWQADDRGLVKILKHCLPNLAVHREWREGVRHKLYRLPKLETARRDWEKFIGHEIAWEAISSPERVETSDFWS